MKGKNIQVFLQLYCLLSPRLSKKRSFEKGPSETLSLGAAFRTLNIKNSYRIICPKHIIEIIKLFIAIPIWDRIIAQP